MEDHILRAFFDVKPYDLGGGGAVHLFHPGDVWVNWHEQSFPKILTNISDLEFAKAENGADVLQLSAEECGAAVQVRSDLIQSASGWRLKVSILVTPETSA